MPNGGTYESGTIAEQDECESGTGAERERKRMMFLFLACNWVILYFCSNYYMIYIVIRKCDLLSQKERDRAVTIMEMKN